MNLIPKKTFLKDMKKIHDNKIREKIEKVICELSQAEKISDVQQVKKIVNTENGYYRIRFDYNYRIGIYVIEDTVELLRVDTQERFYKIFP